MSSGDQIRDVVKRGKRFSSPYLTIHFLQADSSEFAVVVSKAVGNAVQRNLVKRRTRAALFEVLKDSDPGLKAVFRMRPEASSASWVEISESIKSLIAKARD